MPTIISILIGFLSIALMITVHEAGHFFIARAVGINVEVFAIGWGKAVKRWHVGETEIRINIFPLGGYCKLQGTEDLRRSLDRGEKTFQKAEKGSLFAAHPIKRILTYIGGPLFNLLFAALIFIPFFLLSYDSYADPNQIIVTSDYPRAFNLTEASQNAAQQSGIVTGDIILKIDQTKVTDFFDIQNQLSQKKAGEPTLFTILRDGQTFTKEVIGLYDKEAQKPLFGISAYMPTVIGSIQTLSPESMTDLRRGDRVIGAQGQPVAHTLDLIEVLSDNPSLITLTVLHADGEQQEITYSPQRGEKGHISLGFTFEREIKRRKGLPFSKALPTAFTQTLRTATDTLLFIPQMFSGMFAFDDVVAGPLRISYIIGETRSAGLRAILHLLAMVSTSLAVANLLPIPGLDGGAIVLSLLEIVRRKSVSPQTYVKFQSVGLIFLLLLMIFVVAGDVRFLFSGS